MDFEQEGYWNKNFYSAPSINPLLKFIERRNFHFTKYINGFYNPPENIQRWAGKAPWLSKGNLLK